MDSKWDVPSFRPPLASNPVYKNITFAYLYHKASKEKCCCSGTERREKDSEWKSLESVLLGYCLGHQKMKQVFDSQIYEGIQVRESSLRQVQKAKMKTKS